MSQTASSLGEFRKTAIINTLRQCRMFSDLPESDLEEIADTCSTKPLGKGEYLFHESEKAHGFYIVQAGAVNVHRVTPGGKEQVICIFRPGESFAEVALSAIESYPADAVALEPSQVLLVHKSDFRNLITRKPELALRMLTSMSFHFKHLVQLIEDMKFKQIEGRLAHWLLRNCPTPAPGKPGVIELNLSKRILASQLGVTSETLSRTLAKFREENLIQVEGRVITLLDAEGLQAYLGDALAGPSN